MTGHHADAAPADTAPAVASSAVPDPADAPWWTRAVVYQIYPRSFADGDGDGFGDLAGIASKLDHLAELGVDVIWLSPIYPSPQHDNGYDIADYQDIDPRFGTLEEFDALLAAAHERGMKLIMDLVVNHTSDEHAWFLDSRSSRAADKRDWYIWRDPRPGFTGGTPGAEPTNWRSFFSGPAWQWDEATGQYFLRLFAPQQPDLNWDNPDVRRAVYAMMRWWLDRGVDGFRMDVINLISKGEYVDVEPVTSSMPLGAEQYANGPRVHEYLSEMHREVFAGRDAELMTVGETPGTPLEHAQLYTDPTRAEVDMIFQFEHVGLDHGKGGKWDPATLDLRHLKANLARWQDGLFGRGWNSLYLNNHDQPRLVSRFGDDGQGLLEQGDVDGAERVRYASATAWAAVLHLQCGTPFIYQGEEFGMTNVPFGGIEDFADVEAVNHYTEAVQQQGADPRDVLAALRLMTRDNARTPVQWDDSVHGGFSAASDRPDVTPWMPVNPNYATINAAADRASRRSIFRFYQRLIALRHTDDVVAFGRFDLLEPDHEQLFAYTRTLGDRVLLVTANLSGRPCPLPSSCRPATARPVLTNVPDDAAGEADPAVLQPWEVRVVAVPAGVPDAGAGV
ncbi:glucohydrolase [Tersicoccus solisilvae]|uniref:Glucohydrolase n=1 Tax=Tersicoccus solisilvae TaxID=1882339 RepID=A0ABQ1NY15_9MICC|nr:alpha-glucosidase [Tersicoccus solisilvae]GGC87073.1 glucohydrolase [Tersicoccus solisilvae]